MGTRRPKGQDEIAAGLNGTGTAATVADLPKVAPVTEPGRFEAELPAHLIDPSPNNPRTFRDDAEFKEFTESIRAMGVIEPVVVKEVGGRYRLLAGERRWRATLIVGPRGGADISTIPALVRNVTEAQELEITVTENLHRENLHPLDEAKGVRALLASGQNMEDIAARIGKSRKWVARRASLADLIPEWQKKANDPGSVWYQGSIRCLEMVAALSPASQKAVLHEVAGQDWREKQYADFPQEMSRLLDNVQKLLAKAPFDPRNAELVPDAGACTSCPKRSSCKMDLFDHEHAESASRGIPKGDRCLDSECFATKVSAHIAAKVKELRTEGTKVALDGEHGEPKATTALLRKTPQGAALAGEVTRIETWNLEAAKKGDKGAFAVVKVRGVDAGQIEWFKNPKEAAGKPGAKGAPGEEKKPPTMKERIEKIHQRRVNLAADWICGILRKPSIEVLEGVTDANATEKTIRVTSSEVLPLVFLFGLMYRHEASGSGMSHNLPLYKKLTTEKLAIHDMVRELTDVSSHAAISVPLVSDVCGIMANRIANARNYSKGNVEKEVTGACRALRLDYEAFLKRAEAEIPFPKSWRAEAEAHLAKKAEKAPEEKPAKASRKATRGAGSKKKASKAKSPPPENEANGGAQSAAEETGSEVLTSTSAE